MDCFVAIAPGNDEFDSSDLPAMANQIRAFGLRQINPTGKSPKSCQANNFRISEISLANGPKSLLYPSLSRPTEGRWPTSSTRDGMRWTQQRQAQRKRAGRMMLQRTAKSCRSDAPMLASSLREEAQATVSNKPGHRGDHEVSRKTIAQGRPCCFR